MTEIEHIESIEDEATLNNEIKRRISGEAGTVIDLKQKGLKVIFDQDVKSKYFEANWLCLLFDISQFLVFGA